MQRVHTIQACKHETGVVTGWDSDLSSVLLLSHLIPPSAQGRKRPGKVSASQAEKHLVIFKKVYIFPN